MAIIFYMTDISCNGTDRWFVNLLDPIILSKVFWTSIWYPFSYIDESLKSLRTKNGCLLFRHLVRREIIG
jgi:hypothetical protein